MANFTTTFILHSVIPWNNTDTKAFALIVRWWLILLQTMQSVHRNKQTLNYFDWLLLFKNRQHCLPSKEIAVFVQQWHLPLSNSYKIWLRVNKSFCLKYSYWVHGCYNIASYLVVCQRFKSHHNDLRYIYIGIGLKNILYWCWLWNQVPLWRVQ